MRVSCGPVATFNPSKQEAKGGSDEAQDSIVLIMSNEPLPSARVTHTPLSPSQSPSLMSPSPSLLSLARHPRRHHNRSLCHPPPRATTRRRRRRCSPATHFAISISSFPYPFVIRHSCGRCHRPHFRCRHRPRHRRSPTVSRRRPLPLRRHGPLLHPHRRRRHRPCVLPLFAAALIRRAPSCSCPPPPFAAPVAS